MTFSLPQQFRELEQWSSWSRGTEWERHNKRVSVSMEELKTFVAALKPHMEDLIQYMAGFKWGTPLGAEDTNLFHLGLAYMEATVPVDLKWKTPVAEDSFPVARVAIPPR